MPIKLLLNYAPNKFVINQLVIKKKHERSQNLNYYHAPKINKL